MAGPRLRQADSTVIALPGEQQVNGCLPGRAAAALIFCNWCTSTTATALTVVQYSTGPAGNLTAAGRRQPIAPHHRRRPAWHRGQQKDDTPSASVTLRPIPLAQQITGGDINGR